MTREELAKDALEWGNALNDASWDFVEAYHDQLGTMPVPLFNNLKGMLRAAILSYIERAKP